MPASRTQSYNEAQDLLLLQDHVCKLSHTQRTLEDTCALLRIRVEARVNVTERAVVSGQLQLMQASIQHYLQRTSTQLIQVAHPGLG